jgi:prepilin-type N-terminal cleavage/methylation domain-containing protein
VIELPIADFRLPDEMRWRSEVGPAPLEETTTMIDIRQSVIGNRQWRPKAFTLIELLIVIGIILILISILVPTANQVRVAAQSANTRQMIARIEAGIQSYYSDFQAYPGPFTNAELKPFGTGNHVIGTITITGLTGRVTSSENLYLGLSGGLSFNGTAFSYSETLARNQNGPANLNAANLKRYNAYMSADPTTETTLGVSNEALPGPGAGHWTPATGDLVGDTVVPEFLDKYSRPAPILYLRATRGAVGFLNDTATFNSGVQYNIRALTHTYAGSQRYSSSKAITTAWDNAWVDDDFKGSGTLSDGHEAYFGNSAASASADVPAKKDEFLLISAGPDGVYGTRDDITNFR